jgi:hypothetical protein
MNYAQFILFVILLICPISCSEQDFKKSHKEASEVEFWQRLLQQLIDKVDNQKKYTSYYIFHKFVCESCFEGISTMVIASGKSDNVCFVPISIDSQEVLRNRVIYRNKLHFAYVKPAISQAIDSLVGIEKATPFQTAVRRTKGSYEFFNHLHNFLKISPNVDSLAQFICQ